MTEDTTGFSYLLSGSVLLLALLAFYIARALWIVRHEWSQCRTDTKILYLLVAPVLTFAVDVLTFTDRLLWGRNDATRPHSRSTSHGAGPLRTKVAARSDG